MPEYRYAGSYPAVYPENRDARGAPLGLVTPGDIRDFEQPPDRRWVPADDSSADQAAAGEQAGTPDQPAGTSGISAPAAAVPPLASRPVRTAAKPGD